VPQNAVSFSLIVGVNAVAALASFSTSLTGFGYALVSCPLLLLLLPPKLVVPATLLSSMALSAILIAGSFRDFDYRRVGIFLLGGLPGAVLGVHALASLADSTMTRVIGAITVAAAVSLWVKPRRPLGREGLFGGLAGCLSGILGGASGLSGPPVVLFGLKQQWDHRQLRADLICYFALLHGAVLLMFRDRALLQGQTVELGLWMLPGLLVGYLLALALRKRVSQGRFRALSLGIVTFGGFAVLVWS